jgi:FtsZ-binding cell division protein ZapB
MKKPVQLPDIPEKERTPLVGSLITIIEQLTVRVQQQDEEIQLLKDEVRILKGEKKRPTFKPSKLDKETEKSSKDDAETKKKTQRPGSSKRSKNAELTIHEEKVIQPEGMIPPGSRFKGYRDFVVQELEINTHNIRYRLARWETPEGQALIGQLPSGLDGHHYGPHLISYVLYQHHHCQVTQPLLLEQLREWKVDISAGEINHLLLEGKDSFHQEKDELLKTGLSVSDYVTVDDSGARHQGKNGYVTQIGNEYFAWFESTFSKSRINFLELLCAGDKGYRINDDTLAYWQQQKLPQAPLASLTGNPQRYFTDAVQWEEHLDELGIATARHRRIATEGALLGNVVHEGMCSDLVIVSDDAGQFNILLHALCWVHSERLIHTLIPLNDGHREDIAKVRGDIWDFYADLKHYKIHPMPAQKETLKTRFDVIFTQKTRYELLNQLLKRIHKNKSELLLVLDRPEIPLHTNGSEGDIRDYVKKKKISGGTRSAAGRRCRDTFASLKKTCRKQGVSFWHYLLDRLTGAGEILALPELICQSAAAG